MFQILIDGSFDLDPKLIVKNQIDVIPFYTTVTLETQKTPIHIKDVDQLNQLIENKTKLKPVIHAPTKEDYIRHFEKFAKDDIDILCICIMERFSSCHNAALQAKQEILEKYPNTSIEVMNSKGTSIAQGLFLYEAIQMKKAKYSLKNTVKVLDELKHTAKMYFTIGNADYLVNGGKINRFAGITLDTFDLKLVIGLEDDHLYCHTIIKNREASKKAVQDGIIQYLCDENRNPKEYEILIGYCSNKEEALAFRESFKQSLQEIYPSYQRTIPLVQANITTACYFGPNAIGIAILKKYEDL